MMGSNRKLIIVQDVNYNRGSVGVWADMINVGKALFEMYNLEKVIIVVNKDVDLAEQYFETFERSEFKDSVLLILDNFYKKYGVNGSIHCAFDHVEEGDTVIICRPSICISENFEVHADKLEIVHADEIEDYEKNLLQLMYKK